MAGSVKGSWDGKDIELNDAATETTLLKILAALQKNGGASGGSGGIGSSSKDASEQIKALSENSQEAGDALEDLEDDVNDFGRGLKNAAKATYDSLWGLTEEFLLGGNNLSDFSQHFANLANEIPIIGGLLGGALQTITGLLDSQIENYRQLSSAGVVFGSSLFDAQRAAAQTNLTLDEFSSVITNNSAAMAMIGGTAGNGARAFANVSRIMTRDFGTSFQSLGIQAAEQAEMTANYLGTLARTGRLQSMTAEQQSASAGKYIMQVDRLAKATGQQREQIEADMAAAAQDDRMAALMLTMGEDAQREMTATLAYIKNTMGPEAESAFIDVISTGGNPMTAMGESLLLGNSELANMAMRIKDGNGTLAEFDAQVVSSRNELLAQGDAASGFRATMTAAGDETFLFQNALQASGRTQVAMTRAQQEQADQIAAGSAGLLGFSARLTELRNMILGKLIESGVFEKLESVFNRVVTYFTQGGGFDAIVSALDGFSTWFDEFFTGMEAAEDPMTFIIDKIKSWWQDVDIAGMIWDGLFGGGNSEPTATQSAANSEDAYSTSAPTITSSGGGGDPTGIGGVISGIEEKLGTFATIVGVGGAAYVAIRALQTLIAGFGTGPVAAGALVFTGMLIGTGGAINLAGRGIDFAGEGVQKVAAGVERMAGLQNVANFTEVATSLGLLGPALVSLTAGGVLDSITSFFGADSPFDKLVEGVNKFSSIDQVAVTNMSAAGLALTGFSGLTDDLDASKVEDYAEAIESLAEAMEELNRQLATTNRGALGGGTGVSAGSLLSSGQMSLGGGSSNGSSDQLDRLNSTMEAILTAINETSRREVTAITGLGNSVY